MQSHFTLVLTSILGIQVRSSDTSTAESGSEVEEMASPKVNKSSVQPRLTPVCEEASVHNLSPSVCACVCAETSEVSMMYHRVITAR